MTAPRAFLCHASEDDPLAERIATALQEAGIDTFFDDWSISAGQSFRQRIDQGISDCTHFLVLLSEHSIRKPWVNAELDAGFVRRLQGHAELLPLRYNLGVDRIPPLLAALHSPQISDATYDSDLRRLIGDIYGISRKPPLGPPPAFVTKPVGTATGLSLGAEKVAHTLLSRSKRGRKGDPEIAVDALLAATGLTIDELGIAVSELETKRLVEPVRAIGCPPLGYYAVEPRERLFTDFDPIFMGWNPREDGVRLAAELINSGHHWLNIADTANRLGWEPRRMNPALSYLIQRGAVLPSRSLDPVFVSSQVATNSHTARFHRDHS